jgi:hypothetical protein
MEKIEYKTPTMEVIKFNAPVVLLEASGEQAPGGGTGFGAREADFDED